VSELVQNIVRAAVDSAEQLRSAGVQTEAIAEYVAPRRVMLVHRPATMQPLGEVWRLGVLLLNAEAGLSLQGAGGTSAGDSLLYVAGKATRSAKRLHPGNQSISREERRDIAAAALKGGYPEGRPVNYDVQPIELDDDALRSLDASHPLGVVGDEVRVRWRAGASLDGAPTLAAYLAERVDLLAHPPHEQM